MSNRCEYCEGTGRLGFQLETCWFCDGKGVITTDEESEETK
jgi:DnaJ-class molecular chaperone